MSETITLSPARAIGSVTMDVTIEESGTDDLTITQHPVEQGAAITDHAYKNPAKLNIRAGSSNSSDQSGGDENYVTQVYQDLLALQVSRVPFQIVTGKRTYSNMMFTALGVTTDQETEAAIMVSASFQEIIIVTTTTTTVPPTDNQAAPQKTAPVTTLGTVQPHTVGTGGD